MVSNLSRQFMVYGTLLKKLTERQAMNERGLEHVSATETCSRGSGFGASHNPRTNTSVVCALSKFEQSLFQNSVEHQASFFRPSSAGSESWVTTMCSDGSTKSTDDSSSFLRLYADSELLERSGISVEFEERQKASNHTVPVETAPVPAIANCFSTTAINLVNGREVCVVSRELQDYGGQFLGPDTSYHKAGEEGSLTKSSIREDLSLEKGLLPNGMLWDSVEAQGGSPIQPSKAQGISLPEELRRVAASFGQKACRLEGDTVDVAGAIFNVQIEERMDLHLRPNGLMCHAESDNHLVRVFYEDTSNEDSDPLRNNSDSHALACADTESAGVNLSVSQTADGALDELQASLTNEHFGPEARVHEPKPVHLEGEPLPLITTSKIDSENRTLTLWKDPLSSDGIAKVISKKRCTNKVSLKDANVLGRTQDYNADEKTQGSRKGKRRRCVEDTLTGVITGTKPEGGLASSIFPSNYMGFCFECKGPLTSAEKVICSRNDCDRVYHLSCTVELSDVSWNCEGKLVCPQHVCYACGKSRGARLWRCQKCSLATHENCIPCPEVTTLFHNRPGWAICWRHSPDIDYKLKTPTWDCQDIFRYLPVPEIPQDFSLTSEFIKEVMENDREPPPYFFIRRNVFLIKKKRDDADDGVGCSCKSMQDECGDDCECRVQSMSCSKDCKCSAKCCNKPFRKDKRLKVVKTARCGWGAYAAEAIKKDVFIIEYTGEVIDDAMCEKRLWEMKGRRSICNFYMCEIAKDFIIDATRKGNASRYLNHSCQPNCRLEKWRVDGETRVGVFAGRSIVAGEELTYDYKYVEFGPNVKCCCGAPNCRGVIGERLSSSRKSNNINPLIKWGSQNKRSQHKRLSPV